MCGRLRYGAPAGLHAVAFKAHNPPTPNPHCCAALLCRDDNARLQGEVERAAQQQAELSSSVERLEAEAAESQRVR